MSRLQHEWHDNGDGTHVRCRWCGAVVIAHIARKFSEEPCDSDAALAARVMMVAVEALAGNCEAAHAIEDAVMQGALERITRATTLAEASRIARIALGCAEFKYPRWRA